MIIYSRIIISFFCFDFSKLARVASRFSSLCISLLRMGRIQ